MLFLSRAASFAAVSFAILTLGVSTPGKAWDLNRAPATAPALSTNPVLNAPDGPAVPASPAAEEVTLATTAAPSVGVSYASLAAAVAAQDTPGDSSSELACLAGAVYFESKGEPLSGQLAVANVILNRTTSGRFPTSVCGVVKQPGQFSFVRGGSIPAIRSGPQYRTALAIARIALADQWESPAPKALYFHARYVSPGWSRARVAMIGNQVFYR